MYGGQTGVCAIDCHGKMLPEEILVIGISQSRGKWVSWGVFSRSARVAEGRKSISNAYWAVIELCVYSTGEGGLLCPSASELPWLVVCCPRVPGS